MKKYIIVAILLCCSSVYPQLSNQLNKTVDGIATVRNASTLLDSLFFTSKYSQAIFDIIAHVQKVGQNIDNYTSVASAKTAAKANSGMLVVPRKSSLFQDSTITVSSTDSIIVFDFRDGKLSILGTSGGVGDFKSGGDTAGADRTLGNTDNFDLGFLTNNLNRLHIQNDGNVGIGLSSPASRFHIGQVATYLSSAGFRLTTTASGNNVTDGFGFFMDASNNVFVENREVGYVRFDVNLLERLRIDSDGTITFNETGADSDFRIEGVGAPNALFIQGSTANVGIGTGSPLSKLHLDAAGGTDGTGTRWDNGSATTTDATLTTVFTLATVTDRDYLIEASYVASETDGTNEYYAKIFFAVSNVGGTVTEDAETDDFEQDNSAASAADASGAVSGTNYLIQWTGVAAETWNCEVSLKITVVAH